MWTGKSFTYDDSVGRLVWTLQLDKLTDEQVQRLLVCEHGSINESLLKYI